MPSQKELFQMFLTILALMGGTMFILSDFFLNILVRKSMKLLGWNELFDYESITGCFLCGSMQVHNLKVKKLYLSQNQSLSGNINDLYIVIPWYLVAREVIAKKWNEKSKSFLALPRFVVIGGDLNCSNESSSQSVAESLGFDTVIVEGMGFFDLKINGENLSIDIDRLEIFDSFAFERNASNFQSLALYSNGKFKVNNVKILSNIHHDDPTKNFDRSKQDEKSVSYYNWVQDNTNNLSTEWLFEDGKSSHTSVAVLCKKHNQHNFIQMQTHLSNNPTPHNTFNIPPEKFQQSQIINYLSQYLPSFKF
ncbi:predicted protein [Naegleria gruberi]|uniref:Predicted protein n=1 Tax=Naegleria gruberi TaxID=5762 RepID=D2V9L3_NAEGR|nr:uncharacterized protein NAEGRDRAFT_65480 [Naegleria gruberi]EFC46608.1 predicted protein [Naegleria gruberi]|eukprot:XP_002679352.1 predicted protein [Naegleria gruberi strain NEG-M]